MHHLGVVLIFISAILACARAGYTAGPINGKDGATGPAGATGAPGTNGQSCSVRVTEQGVLATCPDGSSALIPTNKKCQDHGNGDKKENDHD